MSRHELQAAMLALRAELRDEAPSRITASTTPRLLDADGVTDRKDADERGIGLPLTAAMHRYIGHWSHWRPDDARHAYGDVSDWCHRLHSNHVRPGYSRPLCAEMLYQAARLGQEPEDLAWLHELPVEQVERMLLNALREARERKGDRERRLRKLKEPLPYERVVSSTLPGMVETA